MARWDGETWTRVQCPAHQLVNSLWVAGRDEVYATTAKRSVLEGSAAGLHAIGGIRGAVMQGDVACVAKWKERLWVGSDRLGENLG